MTAAAQNRIPGRRKNRRPGIFANLERDIHRIADADYVHVDVMDGVFVPNISIGIPVVKCIRPVTDLPLDVHLMIDRPVRYVEQFCDAGGDLITCHVEADTEENIHSAIVKIHAKGKKAGVVVKPKTPASAVLPFINEVELILVMTVEPGFGGQGFIPECMDKIKAVRAEIQKHGYQCELEIDGGAKLTNTADIVAAGADVIVAGSEVLGGDIEDNVKKFHEVFEEGAAKAVWTK